MAEQSKRFVDFKFGIRFKELLECATKEDKEALAKHLNTTTSAFRQWTNGYALPTCENLSKLARFFNVSTDWLLGLSDYQKIETRGTAVDDIGLSEGAVRALLYHKEHMSPILCESDGLSLLEIINLLLEQELPSSEYAIKRKEEEEPVPLISKIRKFLIQDIDSRYDYAIDENGELITSVDVGSQHPYDSLRYNTVPPSDEIDIAEIVEQLMLDKIENQLKKLKRKLGDIYS